MQRLAIARSCAAARRSRRTPAARRVWQPVCRRWMPGPPSAALPDADVRDQPLAAGDGPARMDSGRSATGRRRAVGGVACGAALLITSLSSCITKDDAKKMIEALQTAQPSRPDVLPA